MFSNTLCVSDVRVAELIMQCELSSHGTSVEESSCFSVSKDALFCICCVVQWLAVQRAKRARDGGGP